MSTETQTTKLPYRKRWKVIRLENFKHHYAISNHGDIKAIARTATYRNKAGKLYTKKFKGRKILTRIDKDSGYTSFSISTVRLDHEYNIIGKISSTLYIHREMANAFLPNPNPKVFKSVEHIDGDKRNNCITNLRWVKKEDSVKKALASRTQESIDFLKNYNIRKHVPIPSDIRRKMIYDYTMNGITYQGLADKYGYSRSKIWKSLN